MKRPAQVRAFLFGSSPKSGAVATAEARVASHSVKPLFRGKRPSLPPRRRYLPSWAPHEGQVGPCSDACASRPGPQGTISLADPVGGTGPRTCRQHVRACVSLRTLDAAAGPAWKVASVRVLAARRRAGSYWPSSMLAMQPQPASEGTRTTRRAVVRARTESTQPDPQERCDALAPGRHAQASERTATGLSSSQPDDSVRTRREGEGRFLRDKGFTEQEATLAFAVGPAPDRWSAKNRPSHPLPGRSTFHLGCSSTPTAMWSEPAAGTAL